MEIKRSGSQPFEHRRRLMGRVSQRIWKGIEVFFSSAIEAGKVLFDQHLQASELRYLLPVCP